MNELRVVINNRDRLTTTVKLVEDLLNRNTKSIWIIDNGSSYPPLLDWYNKLPSDVTLFRYHNIGHYALWSSGLIKQIKEDWCFYTDSDIELNSKMPVEYQCYMLDVANKYSIDKIGAALSIDNIPDHYSLKEQVLRNEDRWWLNEVEPNIYRADTDTTFCLIKKVDQFESLRIAGDFTCKHTPWYIDLNNLDEEEKYYISNIDVSRVTQYTRQHKSITEEL
jgi:hypothetical protein